MEHTAGRLLRAAGALVLAAGLALGLVVLQPSAAHAGETDTIYSLVNDARWSQGSAGFVRNPAMDAVAADWAAKMAQAGTLSHNPSYSSQIPGRLDSRRRERRAGLQRWGSHAQRLDELLGASRQHPRELHRHRNRVPRGRRHHMGCAGVRQLPGERRAIRPRRCAGRTGPSRASPRRGSASGHRGAEHPGPHRDRATRGNIRRNTRVRRYVDEDRHTIRESRRQQIGEPGRVPGRRWRYIVAAVGGGNRHRNRRRGSPALVLAAQPTTSPVTTRAVATTAERAPTPIRARERRQRFPSWPS